MRYIFLAEERDAEVVRRLPPARTVTVTVDGVKAALASTIEMIALCGYTHAFAIGQLATIIAHIMKADAQMDLFGYVCLNSSAPGAVPDLGLVASPSLAVLVITAQYGEVPEDLVVSMIEGGYTQELVDVISTPSSTSLEEEVH